jgi:hypothetical protein
VNTEQSYCDVFDNVLSPTRCAMEAPVCDCDLYVIVCHPCCHHATQVAARDHESASRYKAQCRAGPGARWGRASCRAESSRVTRDLRVGVMLFNVLLVRSSCDLFAAEPDPTGRRRRRYHYSFELFRAFKPSQPYTPPHPAELRIVCQMCDDVWEAPGGPSPLSVQPTRAAAPARGGSLLGSCLGCRRATSCSPIGSGTHGGAPGRTAMACLTCFSSKLQ